MESVTEDPVILSEQTTQENPSEEHEEHKETQKNIEPESEKFVKICKDFLNDLQHSFPEFTEKIDALNDEKGDVMIDEIYSHCRNHYPENFFNILYKNEKESVDNEDEDDDNEDNANEEKEPASQYISLEIIPGLHLKDIFSLEGITDSMKETIWKYLQLMMFSVMGQIREDANFGQARSLFQAISEENLHEKMKDTMEDLLGMFNEMAEEGVESEEGVEGVNENDANIGEGVELNEQDIPDFLNPDNMQEHISSLLDGKLGKLATEIAEETANELEIDMNDSEQGADMMKEMMSNPAKLMNLVKKVGSKLDSKMKSGDLSEAELMKEASEMMSKMKGMPGMPNMKDLNKMMKNMGGLSGLSGLAGLGGMGKNARVNTSALNTRMKREENINRMREKAKQRVQELNEKKRIEAEYEQKRKEFLENAEKFDVDKLVKELGLENTKPAPQEQKKKKKKKGKK